MSALSYVVESPAIEIAASKCTRRVYHCVGGHLFSVSCLEVMAELDVTRSLDFYFLVDCGKDGFSLVL